MNTKNDATQVVNELVGEIRTLRKDSRKSPKPAFMSEVDGRHNNNTDPFSMFLQRNGLRRKGVERQ